MVSHFIGRVIGAICPRVDLSARLQLHRCVYVLNPVNDNCLEPVLFNSDVSYVSKSPSGTCWGPRVQTHTTRFPPRNHSNRWCETSELFRRIGEKFTVTDHGLRIEIRPVALVPHESASQRLRPLSGALRAQGAIGTQNIIYPVHVVFAVKS